MISASHTPPLSSSGVFSVSSSSLINAPREVVWEVLMDWKSYKEWNPFVRNQCITDSQKNYLPDETPREGCHLFIYPVNIPPSFEDKWFPSSALERITVLDHENYRTAWVNIEMPRWLLNAERWQFLVEIEGEKTRYETVEVFGGVLAYLIRVFVGNGLKKGFIAMAEGLKRRAEQRYERGQGYDMALLLFFARFPWYHRGSEEFYSPKGALRQPYDDLDALFAHTRGAKTTWQENLPGPT